MFPGYVSFSWNLDLDNFCFVSAQLMNDDVMLAEVLVFSEVSSL